MTYRKCVFAGTFDPPTLGHKALIEDCLRLFDEVAVAVMINPDKRPFFTDAQREETKKRKEVKRDEYGR